MRFSPLVPMAIFKVFASPVLLQQAGAKSLFSKYDSPVEINYSKKTFEVRAF